MRIRGPKNDAKIRLTGFALLNSNAKSRSNSSMGYFRFNIAAAFFSLSSNSSSSLFSFWLTYVETAPSPASMGGAAINSYATFKDIL